MSGSRAGVLKGHAAFLRIASLSVVKARLGVGEAQGTKINQLAAGGQCATPFGLGTALSLAESVCAKQALTKKRRNLKKIAVSTKTLWFVIYHDSGALTW